MKEISQNNDSRYDGIRLGNQICFPLYACAKEVVRLYRKPLEALKEKALEIPCAMQGCIGLPQEELQQLKALLDKALETMNK